jgi:hypothetical protein
LEPVLIYFFAAIVACIILLFVFRKVIRMNLIRMKYGKYSYKYVKQFKKYANKSPFPYCFKDDIMPYLRLSIAKKETVTQYQSGSNLYFENFPFQTTLNEIYGKYGKPDCFNAFTIKNIELRAYGYNKIVFGVNGKAVFFFVFDQLVMGEYLIDDLLTVDIHLVSKTFAYNYGIENYSDELHFYIEGRNQSSVYFYENGFSAMIRFSEQNNDIINKLLN